jgi:hypothetical protein
VAVAAGAWVWARSAASVPLAPLVVLRVDTSRPGSELAPGAVGLSVEARELSSGRLSAAHLSLVRLMRLLGPAALRVGGNSVDLSWWTSTGESPPAWAVDTVTPADLQALRGLLAATGWRVLLGVGLGHFEPARAAEEARFANQILGRSLAGIEIGNEPDAFSRERAGLRPPTYGVEEYLHEAEAYRQALAAAAPDLAIYGPATSTAPRGISWLSQVGAGAHMFTELTQHYYPIKVCPQAARASPPPTAAELLSPAVRGEEEKTLEILARAAADAGRPAWIDETNSVTCNGSHRAPPAFAGALWSLDWALRAASDGVTGLNFHGTLGLCSSFSDSPICASSLQGARVGDVTAQPEYYGLLAAAQLEGGRFVPTGLSGRAPLPDLTAWATLAADGTIKIAIDNLSTSGLSQPVWISVPGCTGGSGCTMTEQALNGPSIEASSHITFGGSAVSGEGRWHPTPLRQSRSSRAVRVILRPASAAIVTLRRARSSG